MTTSPPEPSRHLSVIIEKDLETVYRYACDPANLPHWAAGLAVGISCEEGHWYADSPMGRVEIDLAAPNAFGVLDHDVITADGTRTANPVRVVSHDRGCEVIFTLRPAGRPRTEVDTDAEAVLADLNRLRDLLTDGDHGIGPD